MLKLKVLTDPAEVIRAGWFLYVIAMCDKSEMGLIPIMNTMDFDPRCANFLQILYCRHSVRIFPLVS